MTAGLAPLILHLLHVPAQDSASWVVSCVKEEKNEKKKKKRSIYSSVLLIKITYFLENEFFAYSLPRQFFR